MMAAMGPALAIVGLVLLVIGADRLVHASATLSVSLGVPPVVVGALVIGFGTSLPELLASGLAAAEGEGDLAVGSIVGSNTANLSLVLGIVGLLAAPRLASRVLRREAPAATVAVLLFAALLPLGRADGLVLLLGFAIVTALLVRSSRIRGDVLEEEVESTTPAEGSPRRLAVAIGLALVVTAIGAQVLVSGATRTADDLGISGGLVGFTLVALGTSAPEIVAAVAASRRGAPDLAVGNVLGSNIFNSLLVGGVVGVIGPGSIDAGLVTVAWLTVAVSLLTWLLLWRGRRIERWEGALLVVVYAATVPLVA